MRFDIVFTPKAVEDFQLFKKGERMRVIDAIEGQLSYEPSNETRNRKRLRPIRRRNGYYELTDFAFSMILTNRLIW